MNAHKRMQFISLCLHVEKITLIDNTLNSEFVYVVCMQNISYVGLRAGRPVSRSRMSTVQNVEG